MNFNQKLRITFKPLNTTEVLIKNIKYSNYKYLTRPNYMITGTNSVVLVILSLINLSWGNPL